MYQIFVVEDEHLIRQSIRHVIEGMAGPYVFCGEASDGEMALSMMQDLMPDILLTDIRMPFLDGFDLIRHLKAMMPWLKIVIISGYGDFSYAQKAIALGVDMYLLKPIRSGDLSKAIEEMARQIDARRERAALPAGYDEDEMHTALHQHFMRQLLHGSADTNVLISRARTLEVPVLHPYYQVVLMSFDGQSVDHRLLRARATALAGELAIPLYYFNEADRLTLLLGGVKTDALNEDTYRVIAIFRHELCEICPVITTVVGNTVSRVSAVPSAYATAKDLLDKAAGMATGRVIDANDTAQITVELLNFDSPFDERFQERLLASAEEDVPALLRECFGGERFDSMLLRYSTLIGILKMTVRLIERATPGADAKDISAQISSQYDILTASDSRESFEKLAEELLRKAVSVHGERAQSIRRSHVVSRAEEYVREHYCDPNISLMSVARHVGMSAAHFSTVFSQTVGTPFIGYLTGLRVKQAKKLLATTDMRLAAIAVEIGYNEPNYFSHVFRKSEGITPKEFRANARNL